VIDATIGDETGRRRPVAGRHARQQRDRQWVWWALSSDGQSEGQVNKLKLLKRQMYGRANMISSHGACSKPVEVVTEIEHEP
jgi:hypothetical protein